MGFVASGTGTSAGAGDGGGFGAGLNNLLQNRMFLSMLAGAGQDISSGQPIGQNTNQAVQQGLGAQSKLSLQNKFMKSLLSGGAKISMDKDKFSISGASSLLGEEGASDIINFSGGAQNTSGTQGYNPNPFQSSPLDVSGADLGGLTSQDVSQALADAVSVESLMQKKITDAKNMMYQQALTEESRARTKQLEPSITLPGTSIKLTNKQYLDWYKTATKDERTAAIKNYEYAQTKTGGEFKGSFEAFQDSAKTSKQKEFKQAKGEGYEGSFNEWLLEVTKAGGTSIDFGARAEETTLGRLRANLATANAVTVLTDLKKDTRGYSKKLSSRSKEIQTEKGVDLKVANTLAEKEMVLEHLNDRVLELYPDAVFVWPDGWLVDGELIKRNPYAE